jgi:DNA recombination protein RmuC
MAEHLLIGILIGMGSGIIALIVISALTLRRFDTAGAIETARVHRALAELQRSSEQTEQRLRAELAATRRELEAVTRDSRDESALSARALRDEITGGLKGVSDAFGRGLDETLRGQTELARLQKAQTETLAERMAALTESAIAALRDHPMPTLSHLAEAQERQLAAVAAELRGLADVMDMRLDEARGQLDEGLRAIQADHRDSLDHVRAEAVGHAKDLRNELVESLRAQLDDIRSSMDARLESTLESRIEESFTLVGERLQLVGERLEQVHRGLGEVEAFAAGLGNIQRALTNVRLGTTKSRGQGSPAGAPPAAGAPGRPIRRRGKAAPAAEDSGTGVEAPGMASSS